MSALLDHGLEVTALHNHFFWDEPRVFFMHIHGHGKALDLANGLKPAIDLIGQSKPGGAGQTPAAAPKQSTLDTDQIAKIVGHAGEQNGPVYKITLGRDDLTVKEMGATINARMGLNTWAAFYGSNDDAAGGRPYHAGDGGSADTQSTTVSRAGCGRDSPPHDQLTPCNHISPLLGTGTGREVGGGVQGCPGRTWQGEQAIGFEP